MKRCCPLMSWQNLTEGRGGQNVDSICENGVRCEGPYHSMFHLRQAFWECGPGPAHAGLRRAMATVQRKIACESAARPRVPSE